MLGGAAGGRDNEALTVLEDLAHQISEEDEEEGRKEAPEESVRKRHLGGGWYGQGQDVAVGEERKRKRKKAGQQRKII